MELLTCLNMKQAKARKKKVLKLLMLLFQYYHKNENFFLVQKIILELLLFKNYMENFLTMMKN